VLSVLVESDPILNQNFLVHLKINQPDLSRVVATLERFEYNVLEVHQSIEASSIDKERFDQLMRYLGI
jgi:acetoin utilization protein AcuB